MAATKRKTTTKKKATKVVKRATAVKKKATKKVVAKKQLPAVKKAFTKTELMNSLAEATELTKKQIASVFEELAGVIERHVKDRSAGEFTLPGLLKVTIKKKPATKARKGINPFTGEPTVFKAKPARKIVKIKPLKKLKDMVA